jgi:hypothetical protein
LLDGIMPAMLAKLQCRSSTIARRSHEEVYAEPLAVEQPSVTTHLHHHRHPQSHYGGDKSACLKVFGNCATTMYDNKCHHAPASSSSSTKSGPATALLRPAAPQGWNSWWDTLMPESSMKMVTFLPTTQQQQWTQQQHS